MFFVATWPAICEDCVIAPGSAWLIATVPCSRPLPAATWLAGVPWGMKPVAITTELVEAAAVTGVLFL